MKTKTLYRKVEIRTADDLSIDWYFIPIELELPEDEEIKNGMISSEEKILSMIYPPEAYYFEKGWNECAKWLCNKIKESLKLEKYD